MKRWRYLAFALTLSSSAVFANSMKSNFDEGRAYGGTANGNAQNVMKKFSSEQIMPNAGSPEQAKLYTGQNSNPNLGAMGIQALSSTEVGQVLTQSSINNPADMISTESDMLKRSDEIVNNAHYLTGGISGKQCIKQSLSKSHFTNHFCEKDQAINATCKRTQNVVWTGSKSTQNKILELSKKDFQGKLRESSYWDGAISHGRRMYSKAIEATIIFPDDGVITGIDVYYSRGNYGMANFRFLDKEYFRRQITQFSRTYTFDYRNKNLSDRDLNFNVHKNENLKMVFSSRWWSRNLNTDTFFNSVNLSIKIYYKAEVNTLKANLEESFTCNSPTDFEKAIKIGEQCTQEGGSRNFTKDGQTVTLNSDCWEKTETYLVNDASDNECKRYDNDRNCTVGERECLSSENGLCTRFRLKYQCQHTTKTEGVVCGDKFFCSDGSCADLNGSVNADFGHAVSQLASLAQAGKDISLDAQNLRAFSGRPMACRKSGFGFSDCCKDSGWGHKAGIAHCNSEENVLGKAKEKNTVIYVGTYCSKKVLRHCVQRKSTYCVFDSKLARIIQYQGRSGQLSVGFGGAQNPDCRGLTVDELQRLNFNAMDYSDFYSELQQNTKIPNQNQIVDFIQKNIAGQLQQKQ